MNRKGARVLMILPVILLALGSCGIFLVTAFPMASALTVAQRDFSAEITGDILDKFHPIVLEKDGTRLVLLVGGHPYDSNKPWLFVMREDLTTVRSFTINELTGFTNPNPFKGFQAMIDSDGHLVVGTAKFLVAGDTITPDGNTDAMGDFYSPGFPISPSGDNLVNMGASGLTLRWDRFMFCWAVVMFNESRQIRATGSDLQLRAVLANPDPAPPNDFVLLALEEDNDLSTGISTTYFVRVPRNAFTGALPANFMDDPGSFPSFTMENVNGGRLGFTSDGIVAYEFDTQDWTLTPLGSTVASQRLHVGRMDGEGDDVRIGWSFSGGYSCVYNPRTRVLSKVVKWWN